MSILLHACGSSVSVLAHFSGGCCDPTQATYMLPRDPGLRTAYRTSKMQRPRLKIHGAWAFGYCLRIAVLDETCYHDSSLVTEVLAMTLEDVMRICDERGWAHPETAVIVGDNTVRELKNSYNMSYISNLVVKDKFKSLECICDLSYH